MRGGKARADAAKELQALLAETTTITAKEDFITHIRNELILTTARKLGCGGVQGRDLILSRIPKVVIGETASRLAANAFASVSKGRGFNLPSDMETFDKRHDGAHPNRSVATESACRRRDMPADEGLPA